MSELCKTRGNTAISPSVCQKASIVFALLILSFWGSVSEALALERHLSISQFAHDIWLQRDGLPASTVQEIAQTPDGYVWLGTPAGLVRFDGVSFTVIPTFPNDPTRRENVSALWPVADGALWIGTKSSGIRRMSNGIVSTIELGNVDQYILALMVDRHGTLLFGTASGLFQIRGDHNLTNIPTASLQVTGLTEDAQGRLWAGTYGWIECYDGDKRITIPTPSVLATKVLADRHGVVWVGTTRGLFYLKEGALVPCATGDEFLGGYVSALCEDRDGSIWVGTALGLSRISDLSKLPLTKADHLLLEGVLTICEDQEGSLWVGTSDGLHRFKDTSLIPWTTNEGLLSNVVASAIEGADGSMFFMNGPGHPGVTQFKDGKYVTYPTVYPGPSYVARDSSVWVSNNSLLTRFENGKFKQFGPEHAVPSYWISAITEDEKSMILCLGSLTSLCRWKEGQVSPYLFRDGSAFTVPFMILSIHRERDGTLWMAGFDGLWRVKDGDITRYTTSAGVEERKAWYDQHPQSQTNFRTIVSPGMADNYLNSVAEDGKGTLWLGSPRGGLTRFRNGEFTSYTTKEGLLTNQIYSVLVDDLGDVWMSSPRGIFQINGKNFDDLASGKTKTLMKTVFTTADGLKSEECLNEFQPASWKSHDGTLWFPTRRGIVSINPRNLRKNAIPPPVVIEQVIVNGKSQPDLGKLVIPPGLEKIEFHYTALSLLVPERVEFKYQLEGYDKDWVEGGNQRVAYYTRIPPGEYRFRVIACNNDKVWNNQGASIAFSLKPFFYQTSWFYAVCITGVAGAGLLVYRRRERRLMLREFELQSRIAQRTTQLSMANEELKREIAERQRVEEEVVVAKEKAEAANQAKSVFLATMSHEIRTPMNGVIGMTGLLMDSGLTPEQHDIAETIRTSGDALLTIINDILDFSKIEAGKLELEENPFDLRDCVESALDLVAPKASEKDLELAYIIDPRVPGSLVGDVTRVRQILVNLLSNAIKFTEKGEVTIDIQTTAVSSQAIEPSGKSAPSVTIRFAVADTGIGIPKDRINRLFQSFSQVDTATTRKYGGTGLGLAISKRLSECMGGSMEVVSEVGKGSTFIFTIQAPPAPLSVTRSTLSTCPPLLQGRRVLIVDDNKTNRRVLTMQTQAWGMIPRETGSPLEALEWIRRGDPFDIAMLDMQMPEMDGIELATKIRQYRDEESLPMAMFTSMGKREEDDDTPVFAAYLIKPIKQSQLFTVLTDIFGSSSTASQRKTSDAPKMDSSLAERLPLKILLAEDHPVNQKLALMILKKMGYEADTAGDGREALEALEHRSYDIILMDVMMPEMDGLEATRRICQKWPRGKRPFIIAMTANAMQGDREECLAAGMDDYLSKPIHIEDVQVAIENYGRRRANALDAGISGQQERIDESLLERMTALQSTDIQKMIELYLVTTPRLVQSIRDAITHKDVENLKKSAHFLAAGSTILGAEKIALFGNKFEQLALKGSFDGAASLLADLTHEFETTRSALQSHT